jgi:hypothetical protein
MTIATGLTSTSYTDTGVLNGATYCYVVSAVVKRAESPNKVQLNATRNVCLTPHPPG